MIVRKLAWRSLKKATDQVERITRRPCEIPKINFYANSYHESIDWPKWQKMDEEDVAIYPFPLMLRSLTSDNIDEWALNVSPRKYDLGLTSHAIPKQSKDTSNWFPKQP